MEDHWQYREKRDRCLPTSQSGALSKLSAGIVHRRAQRLKLLGTYDAERGPRMTCRGVGEELDQLVPICGIGCT